LFLFVGSLAGIVVFYFSGWVGCVSRCSVVVFFGFLFCWFWVVGFAFGFFFLGLVFCVGLWWGCFG